MARTFTAQLEAFAKKTTAKMEYVAKNATLDVVEGAQTSQPSIKQTGSFELGKIPVDEADLINSLVSSLNGGGGARGATSYATVIAGMELGDIGTFEWNSEYALRIENGYTGTDSLGRSYNVPGRFFVRENAAKFQEFVEKRAREVRDD